MLAVPSVAAPGQGGGLMRLSTFREGGDRKERQRFGEQCLRNALGTIRADEFATLERAPPGRSAVQARQVSR